MKVFTQVMIKNRNFLKHLLLIFVILCEIIAGTDQVIAQYQSQWSTPQTIPGYDIDGSVPYLVADQNKTVHAFTSKQIDDEIAIAYNRWTPELGWTRPVDVILSPRAKIARIYGAYLDNLGNVHLIFFGGNEVSAGIYYSKAPAIKADQAGAWSPPLLIGDYAGPVSDAALSGDNNGHLFVLYSGNLDGNGLYSVSSSDKGATWSKPTPVFLTYNETLWAAHIKVTLDDLGQLHAVWSLVNLAGLGDAIYYSRLEADHLHWSIPISLATVEGYSADWANIIYYNHELMTIYMNSSSVTRWQRRSMDGGRTWSDPVRPFNYVGEYGFVSFIIDSSNALHLFLGNRTQAEPQIHGMWHSVLSGNRWSEPEPIVSGPRNIDEIGGTGFDPSRPSAIVSQGNVVLVTWSTDPGAGYNGIWYSYITLDTPGLPLVPLPTSAVVLTPTLISTSDNTAVVTENANTDSPNIQGQSSINSRGLSNPAIPLGLSAVVVVLLILTVFILRRLYISAHS
jgi:hypothetical protein